MSEGRQIATWQPDGYYGKAIPITVDEFGRFYIELSIGKDEEPLELYSDTLKDLQEQASKTFLAKRPDISIAGTLVDEKTGEQLRATFIGLHAGQGTPRFRDEKGKAVMFERYGDTGWQMNTALFVPDAVGTEALDLVVKACELVNERQKALNESVKVRETVCTGTSIGLNDVHAGYGRMKKTDLALQEAEAAQKIEQLSEL